MVNFWNFIFIFIFCNTNSFVYGTTCSGYQECANETPLQVNNFLSCDGFKSCESSSVSVRKMSTNNGLLYCYGSMACYNAASRFLDSIYCYGSGSCMGITIEEHSLNSKLQCNGYYSCATDQNMYIPDILVSTGYRSLAGTTIYAYSDDSDEFSGIFYGYESLYKGKIYSNGLTTMTLHFYGYHSISNSAIYCEHGAVCKVICKYFSCKNSYIYVDEDSTLDISCDSKHYCIKKIKNKKSLKNANDDITFDFDNLDSDLLDIDDLISQNMDNSIIDTNLNENINSNNIICQDDSSCTNNDIDTSTDRIECHGYQSCNNLDSDILYGYCTGDLACYNSLYGLSDDNDNSYYVCSGYQSCSKSEFNNIEYLLALGFMSLEDTYLENVKNIDAYGSELFQYSTIVLGENKILNLNSYGFASFNSANIFVYGNLNANFYGYISGSDTNIYCFSTSVCEIQCNQYSCKSMKIYFEKGSDINLIFDGDETSNYSPTIEEIYTKVSSPHSLVDFGEIGKPKIPRIKVPKVFRFPNVHGDN